LNGNDCSGNFLILNIEKVRSSNLEYTLETYKSFQDDKVWLGMCGQIDGKFVAWVEINKATNEIRFANVIKKISLVPRDLSRPTANEKQK
jgi:hypothetical protein